MSSIAKISLLAMLTAVVCLGPSCKKASDQPAGPANPPTGGRTEGPPTLEPNEPNQSAADPQADVPPPTEAQTAPDVQLAPIEIKLPQAMFVGTPQDNRVPNLRKASPTDRPPFLAPAGTQLLSRHKPVTGSNEMTIYGEYSMITDGDKEASAGSFVEMVPSPPAQHVTIDLEQQCEIYAIVVWHYHMQPRVYFDVIVQISDDPEFASGVTTVFNNDIDNSAGQGVGQDMHYVETHEGELIDCLSQGSPKGRYVRFYSGGNNSDELNHYIEVDVYGKPVE